MKILIISDTHGHHKSLEDVLERVKPIDMLIHLGDVEGGEDYIKALADCEVHMVGGNNDFFSDLDKEEEFFVGTHRVFITHGNYYNVALGPERIKQEAIERNCDIVMYGHTHRPLIHEDKGITAINPGSISYPRQDGRKKSFIIMEIDRNDEAHYTLNYQ